jgi:hypothetical protein
VTVDLGELTPAAATGPSRQANGVTTLGRLTTTEEQMLEVIEKMTKAAEESHDVHAKAQVNWSSGDPTILEIDFSVEHIEGEEAYLPDRMIQYLPNGGEIQPSPEARLRRLTGEIEMLHERGML